jgi:hypothetical protein
MRRWATNVALLVGVVVLAIFTTKAGFAWMQIRKQRTDLQAEQARLADENARMRPLHEDVLGAEGAGKFFKVCNPGEDPAEIDWVYAAYPSGDHMATFDSGQCKDWRKLTIEGGKAAALSLNSAQTGCNWNGQVVFYAIQYTIHRAQTDDTAMVAGPWLFREDCFTLPR